MAFPVHQDMGLFQREIEKHLGFDDLETFVHHRRRIDRDFRAHGPGWVGQGFRGGYVGEFFSGLVPEAATGRGNPKGIDFFLGNAGKEFGNRDVLGIDGIEFSLALGKQAPDQISPYHQRLLVRECQNAIRFQRGKGRP